MCFAVYEAFHTSCRKSSFFHIMCTWYKGPLRDGVAFISRGRRKSKRGKTGVPIICTGLSYGTDFALRIPGMRSDDVCSTVALDVLVLTWFDPLLLCNSHTHVTPRLLAQRREVGARLPLYRCYCTAVHFLAARLSDCFCKKKTLLLDRFVFL